MIETAIEKRATRRFLLRLPISFRAGDGAPEMQSNTQDVSARGVRFISEYPFASGSEIHFTLTLPAEVTLTESISMRCVGRVIRVENEAAGRGVSVAAIIDRYEFLGGK